MAELPARQGPQARSAKPPGHRTQSPNRPPNTYKRGSGLAQSATCQETTRPAPSASPRPQRNSTGTRRRSAEKLREPRPGEANKPHKFPPWPKKTNGHSPCLFKAVIYILLSISGATLSAFRFSKESRRNLDFDLDADLEENSGFDPNFSLDEAFIPSRASISGAKVFGASFFEEPRRNLDLEFDTDPVEVSGLVPKLPVDKTYNLSPSPSSSDACSRSPFFRNPGEIWALSSTPTSREILGVTRIFPSTRPSTSAFSRPRAAVFKSPRFP